MQLYFLRHAIAVPRGTPGYPNDDRPLTEEGILKMRDAAQGISFLVDGFTTIFSSPLKRAFQTAEIVAEALGQKDRIEICDELLPGSSFESIGMRLKKMKRNASVLLVGHEPEIGYFASAMLGSEHSVIQFKKGALCRIDTESFMLHEPGVLIWHLPPKQLRALRKVK